MNVIMSITTRRQLDVTIVRAEKLGAILNKLAVIQVDA